MTLNEVLNIYSKVKGINYIGVTKVERLMGPYKRIITDIYKEGEEKPLISVNNTDKIADDYLFKAREKAELQALESLFEIIN